MSGKPTIPRRYNLPTSQSNKFKLGLALAREAQLREALTKLVQFADEAAPNLGKMFNIDFANYNEGLIQARKVLAEPAQ